MITKTEIHVQLHLRTYQNEEKYASFLDAMEEKYGKATQIIISRGADKKALLIYKTNGGF